VLERLCSRDQQQFLIDKVSRKVLWFEPFFLFPKGKKGKTKSVEEKREETHEH